MSVFVYRISKSTERARDLSGIGAFKFGGRWNSKGTFMLYTSMNSSLAYLENIVHFAEMDVPPNLYIASIELNIDDSLIFKLPDSEYPTSWQSHENLENKLIGNEWMVQRSHIAIKVYSAVNPFEFNFLLNPLFPGYNNLVTVKDIQLLNIDSRLTKQANKN
ncbi:RES family NAD+ phosphorylase [Mucilaginibacter sp. BJC16-A38]|uniref:RES family NAD+ phosphorylase n=1 Tax=Mucilaginibacter phenanthrenivorans TaxID=1234842 RepID=UPI0021571CBF|nr:RES family NAD+ phosphorylase [Mucilaginibacter phenanthrenivorans]MCR8557919.1 RES family NAD+ phosphorylase [Mucilaginibacter phenanthrenivorans]